MTLSREDITRRIVEASILRGSFTLRSGRTSSYYIDKYRFSTQPDILESLGQMFAASLSQYPGVTKLAGAELGGIPLVSAASIASNLPCVFIRNQKKDYGTGRQLEGELTAGDRVVILEDVATTGSQVLEAATVIEATGAEVAAIIATIDRQEGARENIEGAGHTYEALFTITDLGIAPDAG